MGLFGAKPQGVVFLRMVKYCWFQHDSTIPWNDYLVHRHSFGATNHPPEYWWSHIAWTQKSKHVSRGAVIRRWFRLLLPDWRGLSWPIHRETVHPIPINYEHLWTTKLDKIGRWTQVNSVHIWRNVGILREKNWMFTRGDAMQGSPWSPATVMPDCGTLVSSNITCQIVILPGGLTYIKIISNIYLSRLFWLILSYVGDSLNVDCCWFLLFISILWNYGHHSSGQNYHKHGMETKSQAFCGSNLMLWATRTMTIAAIMGESWAYHRTPLIIAIVDSHFIISKH